MLGLSDFTWDPIENSGLHKLENVYPLFDRIDNEMISIELENLKKQSIY